MTRTFHAEVGVQMLSKTLGEYLMSRVSAAPEWGDVWLLPLHVIWLMESAHDNLLTLHLFPRWSMGQIILDLG